MKKAKSSNSNLHNAKKAKNDEFYTQLTDIEKELNIIRITSKARRFSKLR